jgi:hypothetical protein
MKIADDNAPKSCLLPRINGEETGEATVRYDRQVKVKKSPSEHISKKCSEPALSSRVASIKALGVSLHPLLLPSMLAEVVRSAQPFLLNVVSKCAAFFHQFQSVLLRLLDSHG